MGDLSVIGSRLGGIKMNPGAKQPSSFFFVLGRDIWEGLYWEGKGCYVVQRRNFKEALSY